ncbi:MAG: TAXI family TRAP transporter solute-binding subunit, partial [Pseudomonadota bacterium]
MTGLYKLIALCLLTVFPDGYGLAANKFITIGTGGVTGIYYPTGSAISKLMNQKRSVYGFKVTAEATGGSVFNINALGVGDLDLALSQSDKAAQAWDGQEEWKEKGPSKELRGLFCLNSETVCLIASVKSGIKSCADLKGKIVGVGNPGSGTRQNAQDALSTCGLKFSDLAQAESIKPVEAAALLQDGRIDAYFYTVGHPNGSIKEAAAGGTKVRFIPFPDVEPLLLKN